MRKLTTSTVASIVFTTAVAVIAVDSGDGGFKEAIRDLYAKIRASETSGAGAVHLDDATSNKAKFVIDGLWRMVGPDRAAATDADAVACTAVAKRDLLAAAAADRARPDCSGERRPQRYGKRTSDAANDDGGGTGWPSDEGVQKIMDRFKSEMSLATDRVTIVEQRDVVKSSSSPSPPPQPPPSSSSSNCAPDVNVEELEQKFLAVLRQYDTQKKTTGLHYSTAVGHEPIRGHECKARSPARQNRIFQQLFNRKRIPSGLSVCIFYRYFDTGGGATHVINIC